jgi:hypothetical protein
LLFPLPSDAEIGDELQLLVNDVLVGGPIALSDYGVGQTLTIVLAAADRPVSTTQDRLRVAINYRVVYGSGGGATELGPQGQAFVTDIIRPGRDSLAALSFDPRVIAFGVTPDTLVDDGSGNLYLPATVKGYATAATGDWIQGGIDDDEALLSDLYEVHEDEVGKDFVLRFPAALLEAVDGAVHRFSYLIADRAGNVSLLATGVDLPVRLSDPIGDLAPPALPLFTDDGLIDDADARAPVWVDIPRYATASTGDEIVVRWGDIALPPVTITNPVPAPVLVSVATPYSTLQRDPSRFRVDVSYEVRRAGAGMVSPALTDVLVDLTLPGGPDPDPGTPVHENLARPWVIGAVTGTRNVIGPGDAEQPAVATIPGFQVTPPATAAFIAGDTVQLSWNMAPVGSPYTVRPEDVGKEISISVPSSVLKSGGTGTAAMHYAAVRLVQDDDGNEVPNTALSPMQDVEVTLADDLPGGPRGLPDGDFTEKNRFNAINRQAAESGGGTPFRIPLYLNKKLGDIIEMSWVQYRSIDGSGTPIEPTRYTARHTVSPEDVATEWDFPIPTSKILITTPPEDQGESALGSYAVTAGTHTVLSKETFVEIDMRD